MNPYIRAAISNWVASTVDALAAAVARGEVSEADLLASGMSSNRVAHLMIKASAMTTGANQTGTMPPGIPGSGTDYNASFTTRPVDPRVEPGPLPPALQDVPVINWMPGTKGYAPGGGPVESDGATWVGSAAPSDDTVGGGWRDQPMATPPAGAPGSNPTNTGPAAGEAQQPGMIWDPVAKRYKAPGGENTSIVGGGDTVGGGWRAVPPPVGTQGYAPGGGPVESEGDTWVGSAGAALPPGDPPPGDPPPGDPPPGDPPPGDPPPQPEPTPELTFEEWLLGHPGMTQAQISALRNAWNDGGEGGAVAMLANPAFLNLSAAGADKDAAEAAGTITWRAGEGTPERAEQDANADWQQALEDEKDFSAAAAGNQGEVVGLGGEAEPDDIGLTDYERAVVARAQALSSGPNSGDRFRAEAATTPQREPFHFTPPEIYQRAVRAAEERLQRGAEPNTEAEEYYREPYEERAVSLMGKVGAFMRGQGMEDSERRALLMGNAVNQTMQQMAQHVTVPLSEKAWAQESDAITQAAKLGQDLVAMEIEVAAMMGEYQGRPTAQMTLGTMPYEYQRQVAEGWDYEYTDPVTGLKTTKHVYGTQEFSQMDRRDAQAVAMNGFEYSDPFTGKPVHIMGEVELREKQASADWTRSEQTRTGYWRVVYDNQGRPVIDPKTGSPMIDHVMGTDGLDKYKADLQATLTREGMAEDKAQFAAQLAWEEKVNTGYSATGPNGMPIWVEGKSGLEQQRTTMQRTLAQMGIDHDESERIAEQEYQSKVATGYWGVGPTGHPKWVQGTQDYETSVLNLQSTLGLSADQARWMLDEQTRTGYDKVVQIKAPNGKTWTKTVHVEGTQEFADRIDFRADELTRAGWKEESARDQARFEQRMVELFGSSVIDANGELVNVGGTIAAQVNAQDIADDLIREGWAHDDAQAMSNWVIQNTYRNISTVRQTVYEGKVAYYKAQGMSETAAASRARAETDQLLPEDTDGEEGTLFYTLQEALQKMELDASENRYDAEERMQMLMTSFQALATIGGSIPEFLGLGGSALDLAAGEIPFLKDARERGKAMGLSDTVLDSMFGPESNSSHPDRTFGDKTWKFNEEAGMYMEYGPDGKRTLREFDPDTQTFYDGLNIVPREEWGEDGPWDPAKEELGGVVGWGAANVEKFGRWASGPLLGAEYAAAMSPAAAMAAAGIIASGVWYGVKKIGDWWKGKGEERKEGREAFDEYVADLPEADLKYIRDEIVNLGGDSQIDWEDRYLVWDRLEEALTKDDPAEWLRTNEWAQGGGSTNTGKMSGSGITDRINREVNEAALRLFEFQPTDSLSRVSTLVRGLNDANAWSKSGGDWTQSWKRSVVSAWQAMPKSGRGHDLPDYIANNPSPEQMDMMIQDVARFAEMVNIMSTAELQTGLTSLADRGVLAMTSDNDITNKDILLINQLYDQLEGPDPRVSITERLSRLRARSRLPTTPADQLIDGLESNTTSSVTRHSA